MRVLENHLLDLENCLFQRLAEIQRHDALAPILVVTGSNLLALYLRREYAKRHRRAVNLTCITLDRLVSKLAGELDGFPPFAEELHLDRVLEKQSLLYFKQAAATPGFKGGMLSTLRDLIDGGVPIGSLAVLKTPKREDLVALYQRFSQCEQFCHSAKIYQRATEHASKVRDLFQVREAFFYGFYEFTFVQEQFVNRLNEICPVWLFRLSDAAEQRSPETRFLSCANPVREAEEIVHEIVQLAGEGFKLDQIGILLKNPAEYAGILAEYLDAAEIPYFLNAGLSFSRTPTGKSLLLFLGLLGTDYPRTQMLDFIRSSTLDFARIIHDKSPALHLWEELSCNAGIISGRDNWKTRLESQWTRLQKNISGEDAPYRKERIQKCVEQLSLFQKFMRRFFRWVDAYPEESSWADFTALTTAWMADNLKPDLVSNLTENIGELASLDRVSTPVTRQVFVKTLSRLLKDASLDKGRFQRAAVNICPLMSARGVRFPVVFVPGMIEKEFPMLPSQDPILLDSEREAINRNGQGRLPIKRERIREEELLFSLVQQAAVDRLYLSFPRMDQNQIRPKIISHFLLKKAGDLKGEFVSFQSLKDTKGHTLYPLLRWAPRFRERSISTEDFRMASLLGADRAGQTFLKKFFEQQSTRLRSALEFYRHQWHDRRFTEHEGIISDLAALERLLEDHIFSATQLETFSTCPYQFMLAKLFRLEQFQSPDLRLQFSALDRGHLIHKIYERFYGWALDSAKIPLSSAVYAELRGKLLQIAEEEFTATEESGLSGPRFYWQLEKENIRIDLSRFLQKESGDKEDFRVLHLEKRFGFDEVFDIDLGGGRTLRLRGYIDRIDQGPSGTFRVIDYKSGSARRLKPNSFYRGLALQLPLYLIAAGRLLTQEDFSRLSAEYYYSTGRGGFKRVPFDGSDWTEKNLQLTEILNLILKELRAGHLFPVPGEQCRWCDFRRICDSRIKTIYDNKSGDPALAEFRRLENYD